MFKTSSQGLKIMGLPFWTEMGKLFGIDLRYCLEPLNFSAWEVYKHLVDVYILKVNIDTFLYIMGIGGSMGCAGRLLYSKISVMTLMNCKIGTRGLNDPFLLFHMKLIVMGWNLTAMGQRWRQCNGESISSARGNLQWERDNNSCSENHRN